MDIIWLAAAIIAGVVIFLLKGVYDEREKKKSLRIKIKNGFGTVPQREYSDGELSGIPGYFEQHPREGQIDDITWNDLDMDTIYFRMNQTYSAAGQEYLYYQLRTPCTSLEELAVMEEKITYFETHEEERICLQLAFARLGRTGKFSIYDYLNYLDTLGERNSTGAILADLMLIPAIAMMAASPAVGLMVLIGIISFNIYSYLKQKGEIEPYLTSFKYVLRLLCFAKEAPAISIPVLSQEWEQMTVISGKFGAFKKYARFGMRGSNTAGDPLSILTDYVNMILHLDIICFNAMLHEVRKLTDETDRLISLAGKTETLVASASFRASLPAACVPVFADTMGKLQIQGLYHPLLKDPVKNDIHTKKGVLLTGSNASGKSTFLKSVALNALLAQTIHTCSADSYEGGLCRVYTSMSLRDSLESGESYYIVEIRALKRILDAVEGKSMPVLCFVDEVLRGTNTVERIAASVQILKSLNRQDVICFAATHDIELTDLLAADYNNYHFEEQIINGDIVFPYQLMTGKAVSRNAIRLLGIIGYGEHIISEADRLAAHFVDTGSWT